MKWNIELLDNKILREDYDFFDLTKKNYFKRVFFTDSKNEYGFYFQTGIFFINNQLFDFKMNIKKYEIFPFEFKSAELLFNPMISQNNILSWNIGYDLIDNENKFNYFLSIQNNNEIYFLAKHYQNEKLINQRNVKLK